MLCSWLAAVGWGLRRARSGWRSPSSRGCLRFAQMPGVRPGGRLTFLSHDKKVSKEACPAASVPRKLRCANLSGRPALTANGGVRRNSVRARALHSNSRRKSVHEVWLSCGSQTAAVCCDRRRWLKGWGGRSWTANSQQPTVCENGAGCKSCRAAASAESVVANIRNPPSKKATAAQGSQWLF